VLVEESNGEMLRIHGGWLDRKNLDPMERYRIISERGLAFRFTPELSDRVDGEIDEEEGTTWLPKGRETTAILRQDGWIQCRNSYWLPLTIQGSPQVEPIAGFEGTVYNAESKEKGKKKTEEKKAEEKKAEEKKIEEKKTEEKKVEEGKSKGQEKPGETTLNPDNSKTNISETPKKLMNPKDKGRKAESQAEREKREKEEEQKLIAALKTAEARTRKVYFHRYGNTKAEKAICLNNAEASCCLSVEPATFLALKEHLRDCLQNLEVREDTMISHVNQPEPIESASYELCVTLRLLGAHLHALTSAVAKIESTISNPLDSFNSTLQDLRKLLIKALLELPKGLPGGERVSKEALGVLAVGLKVFERSESARCTLAVSELRKCVELLESGKAVPLQRRWYLHTVLAWVSYNSAFGALAESWILSVPSNASGIKTPVELLLQYTASLNPATAAEVHSVVVEIMGNAGYSNHTTQNPRVEKEIQSHATTHLRTTWNNLMAPLYTLARLQEELILLSNWCAEDNQSDSDEEGKVFINDSGDNPESKESQSEESKADKASSPRSQAQFRAAYLDFAETVIRECGSALKTHLKKQEDLEMKKIEAIQEEQKQKAAERSDKKESFQEQDDNPGTKRCNNRTLQLEFENSTLLLLPTICASLDSIRVMRDPSVVARLSQSVQGLLFNADALSQNQHQSRKMDAALMSKLKDEIPGPSFAESEHPYGAGNSIPQISLSIPGASAVAVAFDPRSCTKSKQDFVRVSAAGNSSHQFAGSHLSGGVPNDFPLSSLLFTNSNTVTLSFRGVSSPEVRKERKRQEEEDKLGRWGFRASATGVILPSMPWNLDCELSVARLTAHMIKSLLQVETHPLDRSLGYFLNREGGYLLGGGIRSYRAFHADEISSRDKFFLSFINGTTGASSLLEYISKMEFKTSKRNSRMLKRRPRVVQQAWLKALRAFMTAMFYHAGLHAEIHRHFSAGGDQPLLDRKVVNERVKGIAERAEALQSWMTRETQLRMQWSEVIDSPMDAKALQAQFGTVELESFCRYSRIPNSANSLDAMVERLAKVATKLHENQREKQEISNEKLDHVSEVKARKQEIALAVCSEIADLCMALLLLRPVWMPPDSAPIVNIGSNASGERMSEDTEVPSPASLQLTRTLSAFKIGMPPHNRHKITKARAGHQKKSNFGKDDPHFKLPQLPKMQKPQMKRVYSDLPTRKKREMPAREVPTTTTAADDSGRNGVEALREWINSYRRWKQWNEAEDEKTFAVGEAASPQSRTSPEDAVEMMVKRGIRGEDVIILSKSHERRGYRCLQGLKWIIECVDSIRTESARIQLLGHLPSAFASERDGCETLTLAPGTELCPVPLRKKLSQELGKYHERVCKILAGKSPAVRDRNKGAKSPVAARKYIESLKYEPVRPSAVSQFLALQDSLCMPLSVREPVTVRAHASTLATLTEILSADLKERLTRNRRRSIRNENSARITGFSLLYRLKGGGHWIVMQSTELPEIAKHIGKKMLSADDMDACSVFHHRWLDCPTKRFLDDKALETLDAKGLRLSRKEARTGTLSSSSIAKLAEDTLKISKNTVLGQDLQKAQYAALLSLSWRAVRAEWRALAEDASGSAPILGGVGLSVAGDLVDQTFDSLLKLVRLHTQLVAGWAEESNRRIQNETAQQQHRETDTYLCELLSFVVAVLQQSASPHHRFVYEEALSEISRKKRAAAREGLAGCVFSLLALRESISTKALRIAIRLARRIWPRMNPEHLHSYIETKAILPAKNVSRWLVQQIGELLLPMPPNEAVQEVLAEKEGKQKAALAKALIDRAEKLNNIIGVKSDRNSAAKSESKTKGDEKKSKIDVANEGKTGKSPLPPLPQNRAPFCIIAVKQGPSSLPGMPASWMATPETLDEEDWDKLFQKLPELTAPTAQEIIVSGLNLFVGPDGTPVAGAALGGGKVLWECTSGSGSRLNIRSGPGFTYSVVGSMIRGHVVEEIERRGEWLHHPSGWSIIKVQGSECLRRVSPAKAADVLWSSAAYTSRLRHRPGRQAGIRPMNLNPPINGYLFRSPLLPGSAMANIRANAIVTGGKWYFEVRVVNPGAKVFRVGIAAKNFHPRDHFGAGQHGATWVFDAVRKAKMNDGSSKTYGGRAKAGDVIGVRLDMTRNTLRFFLNSKDLGIAYEGFKSRGGVFPVVCFDNGGSGEMILDHAKWRSDPKCWGGYHYPLEGDNPRLELIAPTRASRKARSVVRHLDQDRIAVIAEGSYHWCCSIGAKLASAAGSGAAITLSTTEAADVLVASSRASLLPRFRSHRTLDGYSAHVVSSEFVTLCRSLLKADTPPDDNEEVGEFAETWQRYISNALKDCICTPPNLSVGSQSFVRDFHRSVGALAILGGFSEPLRNEGYVMAPWTGRKRRAVVVQYRGDHKSQVKVIFRDDIRNPTRLLRAGSSRLRKLRRGSSSVQLPLLRRQSSAGMGLAGDNGTVESLSGMPSQTPRLMRSSSTTRSAITVAQVGIVEDGASREEVEVVNVKREHLTPISELHITLDEFPLKDEIFAALRLLVVQENTEIKKSREGSGSQGPPEEDVTSWLRAQLRWRAVGVLESLLVHTENLDRSLSREMYSGITHLLLHHAASCPLDDQLQPQMRHCNLLRQRVHNLCNARFLSLFSSPPFQPAALGNENDQDRDSKERKAQSGQTEVTRKESESMKDELSNLRFVYSRPAYVTHRSGSELRRAENPMLDHYDVYIIPRIRFILRDDENFQNDLVLGDHMEQIRKPLSTDPDPQRAAMKAMKVVYEILNNGWISELVYPSPAHDWSLLAPERVRVGDAVEVTDRVFQGILSSKDQDPRLFDIVGLQGFVKSIHQNGRDTRLLVQVHDSENLVLYDVWLPPECLRPVELGELVNEVRGVFSVKKLLARLASRALSLSQLLARRVIFTLCSRSTEPFQAQLASSGPEKGLGAIFDMLFLAVSEGIEFSSLLSLGRAEPGRKREMARLSRNFSRFLASSPLAKALDWRLPSDQQKAVKNLLVNRCSDFLKRAAEFEAAHTRWMKVGDNWQTAAHVSVEGAAALVIMISTDVKLQPGMVVSFYEDPMCTKLLKIIRVNQETQGEDCQDQLLPLEVPSQECWVQVQHAPPYQCRLRLCASPIHPSLGMAFWTIRYALFHNSEWGAEKRTLAFQFLATILRIMSMDTRKASPLKERMLSLSLWLLATGTRAGQGIDSKSKSGAKTHGKAEEKSNVNEVQKKMENDCLGMVKKFKDELASIYSLESEAEDFTLYLQKILDILVTSEPLRPLEDRVVRTYEVKAPAELEAANSGEEEKEEEPEEEEGWNCAICTFLNPAMDNECCMCGSPKPPPQPKKKKAPNSGTGGIGAEKIMHDVMVLSNSMRYLSISNPPNLRECPSFEGVIEAAWRAVKLDCLQNRLLVIENIPVVLGEGTKFTEFAKEAEKTPIDVPAGDLQKEDSKKKQMHLEGKEEKDSKELKESKEELKEAKSQQLKSEIVDPHKALRLAIIDSIKDADPALRVKPGDLLILRDPSKPEFEPPKAIEDSIPVQKFLRDSDTTKGEHPVWEKNGIFYHLGVEAAKQEAQFKKRSEEKKEASESKGTDKIGNNDPKEGSSGALKVANSEADEKSVPTESQEKSEVGKDALSQDNKKREKPPTKKQRIPFLSPAAGKCPTVSVKMCSRDPASEPSTCVLGRSRSFCATSRTYADPAWIQISLLGGRRIIPTGYSILSIRQIYPQRWKLQASDDCKEWTELHEFRSPSYVQVPDAHLEPYHHTKKESVDKGKPSEKKGLESSEGVKPSNPGFSFKPPRKSSQTSPFGGAPLVKSSKGNAIFDNGFLNQQRKNPGTPPVLPENSCQSVFHPISSPEGRGWSHFRIQLVGKDSSGSNSLVMCGFEMFGQLGGPSLGVIPEPKPTNRTALFLMPTSDRKRQDALIEKFTSTILDMESLKLRGTVPRRVQLISHRLDEKESSDLELLKLYARWQILGPLLQPSADHVHQKLLNACQAALLSLESANKSGTEPVKKQLSEIACELAGGKLRKSIELQRAKFPNASLDITIARAISRISMGENVLDAVDWLREAGIGLSLEPQHTLTFPEAKDSQQLFSGPSSSSGGPLKFVEFLQKTAGDAGEPDLTRIAPTQLAEEALLEASGRSIESKLATGKDYTAKRWRVVTGARLRLEILKIFNSMFAELYPLLHNELLMDVEEEEGRNPNSSSAMDSRGASGGMGQLIRISRGFVFESVKHAIVRDLMDSTASEPLGGRPSFVLNRVALARRLESGEAAEFTVDSQFAAAYHQLSEISSFDLKPVRPGGTEPFVAFEVKTEGENVVGLAGPYRQFFTEVAGELMSDASPLLVPTPNRRYGTGESRDRFLFDPSAQSAKLLSMLEFLGKLFAVAMRTGAQVPLSLAPLCWKLLTQEPVSLEDLEKVDHYAAAVLHGLRALDGKVKTLPEELSEQKFTVTLSDGSIHELKPGGDEIAVTIKNRSEFLMLATNARLNEQQVQVRAVRKGIAEIIPVQLLNLMTWKDLEIRVCGLNIIDVGILKRHTKYSGVSSDAKHIQLFWEMFEEFNQEQRRNFIRFCWAQERLPANDAEFERTKTRFQIKASTRSGVSPDTLLPSADTCFFNLTLPEYSTKEIMMKKILYAIEQVTTMDKDDGMEDDGADHDEEE